MECIESGLWSHRGYFIKRIPHNKWIVCNKTGGQYIQTCIQEKEDSEQLWIWDRLKDAQQSINIFRNGGED